MSRSFARLQHVGAALALAASLSVAQAGPIEGQGTWSSSLQGRDANGQPVALDSPSMRYLYDSLLHLTWRADWGPAVEISQAHAKAWAGSLTEFGGGWRLPNVADSGAPGCQYSFDGGTDCGFNVLTQDGDSHSELAHLYYVTLGNAAPCAPGGGTPISCEPTQGPFGLLNTGPFQNMYAMAYWSSRSYIQDGAEFGWFLQADGGYQAATVGGAAAFATAVRDGDVYSRGNAVPEPTSLALALFGLASLGWLGRRWPDREGRKRRSPRGHRTAMAIVVAAAGVGAAQAAPGDFVAHADWAESLARNVQPAHNAYDNDPNLLVWPGVNGLIYQNRTVCGSFVTGNLKQAYGWTDAWFTQWTGGTGPDAAKWHSLIVAGNRFVRVSKPEQIMRGDILAARYLPCAGSSSSGHVMIALGPAIQRPQNTKPVIAGTVQYEILVADSSSSDHFAAGYPDTRVNAQGQVVAQGAGVGWLRLYRHVQTGDIQGYSWSMKGGSTYYDLASCRTLAVGRLQ